MTDHASDFLKQSQTLAQQTWDSWMQAVQQGQAMAGAQAPAAGFVGMPFNPASFGQPMFGKPAAPTVEGMFERALGGMKGYFDWMQQAANAQTAQTTAIDWPAQLQKMFADGKQPFMQAFDGIDSNAATGFVKQWQAWLTTMGQSGMPDFKGAMPQNMPSFGLHREQAQQQQALFAAMFDSAQQQQRYQTLIMRANMQGLERLQARLAERMESGSEIGSMKGLYDLWVDAAEEAYAQIALSEEFSEVYGAMVNAQMKERTLQQDQLEQFCRQLGMPTRSEIDSLGRRLQELRRAQRASVLETAEDDRLSALQAEVAELKKALADQRVRSAPVTKAAPTETASSKKTSPKKVTTKKSKTTLSKPAASKSATSKSTSKTSGAAAKSTSAKPPRSRRAAAKRF